MNKINENMLFILTFELRKSIIIIIISVVIYLIK